MRTAMWERVLLRLTIAVACLFFAPSIPAQPGAIPQQSSANPQDQTGQPIEVSIPDGTPVEIELKTPVSSQTAEAGSILEFHVVQPVLINGVQVVEAGALARGVVVRVQKAGRWARQGDLNWAIQDVTAADGRRVPLRFPAQPPKQPKSSKRVSSPEAQRERMQETSEEIVYAPVLFPLYLTMWGQHKGEAATLAEGERFLVYARGESKVKVGLNSAPHTNSPKTKF
jgi:hypothetical protein